MNDNYEKLNKSLQDRIPPITSSWIRSLIEDCTREIPQQRPAIGALLRQLQVHSLELNENDTYFANQATKVENVIRRALGQGATASVYEGEFNNTRYAIKRFNQSFDKDDYLREIELHKKAMPHPNIVQLVSCYMNSQQNNIAFIVLELMNGGSLFTRINSQEPLNELTVIAIIRDVVNGLAQLHALGIVHRDIRSSNILLETCEEKIRAKISDFGIAIELTQREKQDPQLLIGSPAFMAPELTRNAQSYSDKSDIYALGMLLFEIASRQLPYLKTPIPRLIWLLYAHYDRLNSDLLLEIPKTSFSWLRPLITRCAREDPPRRPSLQQVLGTLNRAENHLSLKALKSFKQTQNTGNWISLDGDEDLDLPQERQSLASVFDDLDSLSEKKPPDPRLLYGFFRLASASRDDATLIHPTDSNERSLGSKSKDAPATEQNDSKIVRSMSG